MTLAIEVNELVRTFSFRKRKSRDTGKKPAQVVALDRVSLTVEHGEVRGLLGPNGAGKTTLVKILSTVLLPTSGTARIFDRDVVSSTHWVRERIGVVFGGERGLYGRISARQNLEYWAALYRLGRAGRGRVEELLEQFGLLEVADMPVDRMSRGMKQRVHLARGMLSRPQLLFLDEPTIGMDPVAAREFHRLFAQLRADENMTVLLTTHDMAQAEELCDLVTLIDHGRILGTESPQEVGQWITEYERVEAQVSDARILAAIRALPGVAGLESLPDDWVRVNTNSPGAVQSVLQLIVAEGITALRVDKPSLQEVYLALIGDRGMKV